MSNLKVLSIDFDYFINASSEERSLLFPDGDNELISSSIMSEVWKQHYDFFGNKIKDITLIPQYYLLCNFLEKANSKFKEVLCSESHKYCYYGIIENITSEIKHVEVYNLDFHHDRYMYGNELNCGNWVNTLEEVLTDKKIGFNYNWCKRSDSELNNIFGKIERTAIIDFNDVLDKLNEFDVVFLCRSDVWSPPHLDDMFNHLVWLFKNKSECFRKFEELYDRKGSYK